MVCVWQAGSAQQALLPPCSQRAWPLGLQGGEAEQPEGVFADPPPVVTLDEVPKVTGEEDEQCLFNGGCMHSGCSAGPPDCSPSAAGRTTPC